MPQCSGTGAFKRAAWQIAAYVLKVFDKYIEQIRFEKKLDKAGGVHSLPALSYLEFLSRTIYSGYSKRLFKVYSSLLRLKRIYKASCKPNTGQALQDIVPGRRLPGPCGILGGRMETFLRRCLD
ncbi:hypothetical protein AWM70_18235 [Paenibacillus yonginensis]|uniref:Uncharacterized protein n=1 Tax=Paenibacillus yonginensis TaxID=1462996 RepID=A0A1B1N4C4_9BACL|nr:hypothetical protein AWM70_18235 [Paenibacillus yonginensis]